MRNVALYQLELLFQINARLKTWQQVTVFIVTCILLLMRSHLGQNFFLNLHFLLLNHFYILIKVFFGDLVK